MGTSLEQYSRGHQLPCRTSRRGGDPEKGEPPASRVATSGGSSNQHVESRQRPTLPRGCPRSTIGAEGLNCRVRNGNGCGPLAKVTGKTCLQRSSWGCRGTARSPDKESR